MIRIQNAGSPPPKKMQVPCSCIVGNGEWIVGIGLWRQSTNFLELDSVVDTQLMNILRSIEATF